MRSISSRRPSKTAWELSHQQVEVVLLMNSVSQLAQKPVEVLLNELKDKNPRMLTLRVNMLALTLLTLTLTLTHACSDKEAEHRWMDRLINSLM